ncbi:hypothetical protein CPJCM30710_27930 [Clostridium polyendosporum]|uniref:Serpin domain-containing protein n=1 Tax=Clostridium polyendosporum TaxID=69208 RepID=A0A919S1M0_9CLOT|nr:hypothetical protein [Clostridium polyendosporum]GIM30127.1 hypothetical protein CPJCM30710_27930 [Clostridium polyendosporum]
MKKSFIICLVIVIIVVASILSCLYYKNINNAQTTTKISTIEENIKTKVYGILNVPMEKNNMIWCGTLQLAWNELRDNIIKEDIQLISENKISGELNKKAFTKEYLNDKDYIVMVGYNKDGIVEKINKLLKKKFNEEGNWEVQTNLQRPDDILAYSFLKKNLEFEYAFEDIKDGLEFNSVKVKIKAFGIYETKDEEIKNKLAKQVKILYYNNDNDFIISLKGKATNNDNDFIISLKGKATNDEVILAKILPKNTLDSTLNYALSNSGKERAFSTSDILEVPMFQFNINKKFKELQNKSIANAGFEDYILASAIQRIDFSLTEKGAQLKSKAEISLTKSAHILEAPKKLIFDKPFLLYMKEKDNTKPYFVMWVDNPEIMLHK